MFTAFSAPAPKPRTSSRSKVISGQPPTALTSRAAPYYLPDAFQPKGRLSSSHNCGRLAFRKLPPNKARLNMPTVANYQGTVHYVSDQFEGGSMLDLSEGSNFKVQIGYHADQVPASGRYAYEVNRGWNGIISVELTDSL